MFACPGYEEYLHKMRTLGKKTTTALPELQYLAYLSIHLAIIAKSKKQPFLAIDIGTYECISALTIAFEMKKYGMDPRVITVDNYTRPKIKGQNIDLDSYRDSELLRNIKFISEMGFSSEFITPVISNSAEYASKLDDWSVDLVYFDGGHKKQEVLDDLNAYYPKLKHMAVLCGHDYCICEHGVIEAVEEFRENHKEHLLGWGLEQRFWWTIKNEKPADIIV